MLAYASQPTNSSHNAFGEVSQGFVRLRGLGIPFNQLDRRVKRGKVLQKLSLGNEYGRRFCNDYHGTVGDWDLLAPQVILLCLRARVEPIHEEHVLRRIGTKSLVGRNTLRGGENSKKQRLRSRCRGAFISAKSAIEDLTSSREQDLLRVGHQFCLMLLPTNTEEEQFYHIGLFEEEHFLSGLSKWRDMTVTVV